MTAGAGIDSTSSTAVVNWLMAASILVVSSGTSAAFWSLPISEMITATAALIWLFCSLICPAYASRMSWLLTMILSVCLMLCCSIPCEIASRTRKSSMLYRCFDRRKNITSLSWLRP